MIVDLIHFALLTGLFSLLLYGHRVCCADHTRAERLIIQEHARRAAERRLLEERATYHIRNH